MFRKLYKPDRRTTVRNHYSMNEDSIDCGFRDILCLVQTGIPVRILCLTPLHGRTPSLETLFLELKHCGLEYDYLHFICHCIILVNVLNSNIESFNNETSSSRSLPEVTSIYGFRQILVFGILNQCIQ